jgi:hypothetical protein
MLLCPKQNLIQETSMADLYLKALESERKSLWATCRLKGLPKDSTERQRIVAIDEAIAAHEAKSKAGSTAGKNQSAKP